MKISSDKLLRLVVIFGSGLFLCACSTVQTASNKPNIILISSDDIGYMDIREYAHHITGEKRRRIYAETPNLDRLCRESLCFEKAYADRWYAHENAGILTGRFCAEREVASGAGNGAGRNLSIASVLPGYDSAFIGKWHSAGTPEKMGFDLPATQARRDNYETSVLTEQALGFIEGRARKRHKPFFLCLSLSAEHALRSVDQSSVRHFENRVARGYKGSGDARHAAMVNEVDESVGRVLQKLWRYGLDENTVVIFMSARKSPARGEANARLAASSSTRVPLIIRWRGYVKAGSWSDVPVDHAYILPTVMQCAGFFPETLSEDAGVEGGSLTGLFRDTRNKGKSYERDRSLVYRPGV